MVEPEIQKTSTDKVFLGGRPMPQPGHNPELQNSRNILSQEMIREKIDALKKEPENSQKSLKKIILYYLAFLYKVFDAKNESDSLLKALERLRELEVCSRGELTALDNDDILRSKDFSRMLGIVYLRLIIPEFINAVLDDCDRERTESIIAHFLEILEERYHNVELKNLIKDLLKYDDDERLTLEDLKERLENMYYKIFEPNCNQNDIILREYNINPEPEAIEKPRNETAYQDPITIEEDPITRLQQTPKENYIIREADFIILVTEEIRGNTPQQGQNHVTPPPGSQDSAHTPEESFLRPPLEIHSRTPTPNSPSPQSPSELHSLFERIRVIIARLTSNSDSNGSQTPSESNPSLFLLLLLKYLTIRQTFLKIIQEASFTWISSPDQSETPSIPGLSERFSFISKDYQDSLSSLEELRTLLESFESQPPYELPDLPAIPENIPLLSSFLSEETRFFLSQYPAFSELFAYLKHQGFSTKICDSNNADSSLNCFSQFDFNSTASGYETPHEEPPCPETPWMDSIDRESGFESFIKCKRGRVCNLVQ